MHANPRIHQVPEGPYIEIDGGSLYLGRDCVLALRVPALQNKVVSNRHLRIWLSEGRWLLEDLDSTNGTWMGDGRIEGRVALQAGDTFALGKNGPRFAWEPPDPNPAAGATVVDTPPAMAATLVDDRDGSDERPFRVGRTPEVVLMHRLTGKTLRALGYTVVLGRDASAAQLVIRSESERQVSSRHAEIRFLPDGTAVVRDLGSRNGTFLNGMRVDAEAPLRVGDALVLGLEITTLEVTALIC